MSAPIGKGDWVECVNDTPLESGVPVNVRRGQIYRVLRVLNVPRGFSDVGAPLIIVAGAQHAPGKAGFYAYRFRPIYRPRQSLIDSLKAPPKEAPIQQPETVGGSAGFGPRVAARLVPGET